MMHVHINVKCSGLVLQELQYCQHNIIRVTKSRSLAFLRMMQPATPVNCDISLLVHKQVRGINRTATAQLAKFVKSGKTRTIASLIDIKLRLFLGTIDFIRPLLL